MTFERISDTTEQLANLFCPKPRDKNIQEDIQKYPQCLEYMRAN